nr:hypothetical protein [Micromonospora sp. DSM 115978]
RVAARLGDETDAEVVVAHLARWHQLGLLDSGVAALVLTDYLGHASFRAAAPTWQALFDQLPASSLPPVFEAHEFLGRGAAAAALADTPARQQAAVDCCLRSPRLDDVEAGLALAERIGSATARALQDRAADLLSER